MRLIMGSHVSVSLADSITREIRDRVEVVNPSYATLSSDGRLLYVVSEDIGGPGMVHGFRIEDGRLLIHGIPRPSGGSQPCHASIHPGGRFLFVANYGDGTLSALPIADDDTLGEPSCVVRHRGSGPDLPRQEGPHVHQVLTDPSGQWVLACDLGTDEVVVYRFDENVGRLDRHSAASFTPGQGVRHLAFSPRGDRAYVTAELSSELVACDWDADKGVLEPRESINTVSMDGDPVERNYPAAVVVSLDGTRVYVTNRGHDSIAVIDTGLFELIGTRSCEGEWPRDACLSPDGNTLFVANEHSGTVVPFDVTARVPEHVTDGAIDCPEATSVIAM